MKIYKVGIMVLEEFALSYRSIGQRVRYVKEISDSSRVEIQKAYI